jgi:hypothetical protein
VLEAKLLDAVPRVPTCTASLRNPFPDEQEG